MERRIIVGTDGSASAGHAVDWAAAEADRRGSDLVIVNGWLTMAVATDPTGSSFGPCQQAGREVLDAAEARCRAAHPGLTVTTELVASSGERALIGSAAPDDLVVTGARGHGAVGSLLLGSTADRVLHHAPGTVVIVR